MKVIPKGKAIFKSKVLELPYFFLIVKVVKVQTKIIFTFYYLVVVKSIRSLIIHHNST